MARGHKIEAIKIYRQATGCGLKEAKDAIDAAAGEFATVDGARSHSGGNWLTIVMVLIVVAVILAAFVLARR